MISNIIQSCYNAADILIVGNFSGTALNWGLRGVGMGAPIASLGSLILIGWFYLSGRWRKNVIS